MRTLVAVAALVAAPISAPAALADSRIPLPLKGFGGIEIDRVHEQIFVSGGFGEDRIAVLDFDGGHVDTITGQPGAAGMTLSPDARRLYVALSTWDAISVIDAAKLDEVSRHLTAPRAAPRSLAYAGGRVWFGFDCGWGGTASMKPDGSDMRTEVQWTEGRGPHFPEYCPIVAARPEQPVLAAGEMGVSPTTLYTYDTSSGAAELQARVWNPGDASNLRDIAIDPSGESIVTASGSPYYLQRFRVSDLARVGTYITGPYPIAVDVSADGEWVAGATDGTVFVFAKTSSKALVAHTFSRRTVVFRDGIAFGPNGRLYVVAVDVETGSTVLEIIERPALHETSLSLAARPDTVTVGRPTVLTGRLVGAPAGERVAVHATPYGAKRRVVATATTGEGGSFAVTVRPRRKTSYVARFGGDLRHAASSSAPVTVAVRATVANALRGFYGRSRGYALYQLGESVRLAAWLTPRHVDACLRSWVQVYASRRWRTVGVSRCARTDADGIARFRLGSYATGPRYRVRAAFSGDADHLGGTGAWRYFRHTR